MDANPTDYAAIGQQFLRTAWLFQGACSLPTLVLLGGSVFDSLLNTYISFYRVVAFTLNALFAGTIIFIVLMQRKLGTSNVYMTTHFEVYKSILGTVMWVWLMLDSAFYHPDYYYKPESRLHRAALAFIVLPTLFYPTAIYAIFLQRKKNNEVQRREESIGPGTTSDENTPLLPS